MAVSSSFESLSKETTARSNERKCSYMSLVDSKDFTLYLKCDCNKQEEEEEESHDDYFIPMSSPDAAICDNANCQHKGTSRCTFCEQVYCENCVEAHFIMKQHKLLYKMPYPAEEKIIFPCYNKCGKSPENNKLQELPQIYCVFSRSFVCSSCEDNGSNTDNQIITYVGNEMKWVRNINDELQRINDNDQDKPTNPTESNDSDGVPIPKSTQLSDNIPATTPNNENVLIENPGNLYPPPSAAAKLCEPEIACECCGSKAENPVKCVYCKRSYHRSCHLPPLPENSTDDAPKAKWKCTMCLHITKLKSVKTPSQNTSRDIETYDRCSLSWMEKKIAQRILMELYCRGHESKYYEERPARLKNHQYYKIIDRPVSLNDVRNRLNSDVYSTISCVIIDLKQVFANGFLYYFAGDSRLNAAINLRDMLEDMLVKWMPVLKRSDEKGWKIPYRF